MGTQKEKAYKRVIDLRGQTTFNQLAYIMRSSMLHFGPDSLGIHLASVYNVPVVGLYSIIQTTVAGPCFGDKSKHILFEAFRNVGNGKPSYSAQENPKCINTVKPEEIANSIFKLLNIDFTVPFKTVFTGKRYSGAIVRELIPNSLSVVNNPQEPIEIRTDLFYDEKILAHHLSYLKKAAIVTNKRLPINLLKYFKSNIMLVVYKITENDDPSFVQELMSEGIPIVLLSSLDNEALKLKKLSYYEYASINKIEEPSAQTIEEFKKDYKNLFFRSCKLVASKDKIYASHASETAEIPLTKDSEYQPVIDLPSFWEDLEFFTIIKVLTKE